MKVVGRAASNWNMFSRHFRIIRDAPLAPNPRSQIFLGVTVLKVKGRGGRGRGRLLLYARLRGTNLKTKPNEPVNCLPKLPQEYDKLGRITTCKLALDGLCVE